MQKLTAKQSILFESKIYAPGDSLPTKNASMVEAWLEAGTAVWIDEKEIEIIEKSKTTGKARPRTAEPGLPGVAVASESENGENLVGKVPKTAGRKRK